LTLILIASSLHSNRVMCWRWFEDIPDSLAVRMALHIGYVSRLFMQEVHSGNWNPTLEAGNRDGFVWGASSFEVKWLKWGMSYIAVDTCKEDSSSVDSPSFLLRIGYRHLLSLQYGLRRELAHLSWYVPFGYFFISMSILHRTTHSLIMAKDISWFSRDIDLAVPWFNVLVSLDGWLLIVIHHYYTRDGGINTESTLGYRRYSSGETLVVDELNEIPERYRRSIFDYMLFILGVRLLP